MFARWPDRFEKLQISISFYCLRGKGRTDLLFCLKKLALFWLSLKENNRAKRKLESRRTTQALRGAKARRESFSLRNGRINPILVLQSSVYRAPLEGIETFAKKISARHLFAFFLRIYPTGSFTRRNRCFRFVSILHPSWNLELISGRNSIRFEGVRELFIGAIGSPFVTNRAAARGLTLQLAMFRGKRGIDGAITWNGHTVVVWASFDFASCKSWNSRPFAAINWEFRFLPVRNKNCWFIDSSFDLVHRRANVGDSSGICEFFLASESEQMILCRVVQFNSIGAFLISDRVGKKRIENKYYRFEIL